jgi:hypothetical protein
MASLNCDGLKKREVAGVVTGNNTSTCNKTDKNDKRFVGKPVS